jgi:hypothetical protein
VGKVERVKEPMLGGKVRLVVASVEDSDLTRSSNSFNAFWFLF